MRKRRGSALLLAVLVCLAGLLASSLPAAGATSAAAARSASGARIVAVAKRFVGKVPYREGGSSPKHGFDCSGYTAYAYKKAGVASLPHNAESQRHARHMRRISAKKARPGDLVFYLSGGRAYHVAIYAGKHMQYAAATVRDGIRYRTSGPAASSTAPTGTDDSPLRSRSGPRAAPRPGPARARRP